MESMNHTSRPPYEDEDDQDVPGPEGDDGSYDQSSSAYAVSKYIQDVSRRPPALPRPGPSRPIPTEADKMDPSKFGNRTMRRPAHFARDDIIDDSIDEEESLVRRANTTKAVQSILERPGIQRTDVSAGGGSSAQRASVPAMSVVFGATALTIAATILTSLNTSA